MPKTMDKKQLKLELFTVFADLARLETPETKKQLADYMFFLEQFNPEEVLQTQDPAYLENKLLGQRFEQQSRASLETVTKKLKGIMKEGIEQHEGALALHVAALEAIAHNRSISAPEETKEGLSKIRQQLQETREQTGIDHSFYHPRVLDYWANQLFDYHRQTREKQKDNDFLPLLDEILLLYYATAIRQPNKREVAGEIFAKAKRYYTKQKGSLSDVQQDLKQLLSLVNNDAVLSKTAVRIKDGIKLYETLKSPRTHTADNVISYLRRVFGASRKDTSHAAEYRTGVDLSEATGPSAFHGDEDEGDGFNAMDKFFFGNGDIVFEEVPPASVPQKPRENPRFQRAVREEAQSIVYQELPADALSTSKPKRKSGRFKRWLLGITAALSLATVQEPFLSLGQYAVAAVEKGDGLSYYSSQNPAESAKLTLRQRHQELHQTAPTGSEKFSGCQGYESAYYDLDHRCIDGNDRYLDYNEIKEKYPYFLDAWVVLEDQYFYDHRGVNVIATGRAAGKYILKKAMKSNDKVKGGSTLTQTLVGELRDKRHIAGIREKLDEITDAVVFEDLIRDEIKERVEEYFQSIRGEDKIKAYAYLNGIFTDTEIKELLTSAFNPLLINKGAKRKIIEIGFNYIHPIATADDKDFRDEDLGQYATYTEAFDAFFATLYQKKPNDREKAGELEKQKMIAEAFMARALRRPDDHFVDVKKYVKTKIALEKGSKEDDEALTEEEKNGFHKAVRGTTHALHLLYQQKKINFNFTEQEVASTLEKLVRQALVQEPENHIFHWYRETVEHDLLALGLTPSELTQAGLRVVIGYDQHATEVLAHKIKEKARAEKYKDYIHIAGVIIDNNGIVNAVIGDTSYDPTQRAFNWANGYHQQNAAEIMWCSTIKPLVVLNALDAGIIDQDSMIYANHHILSSNGKDDIENYGQPLPAGVATIINGTAYARPHILLQRSLNTAASSLQMIGHESFRIAYNRWFSLPAETTHWNKVPYSADTVGIGVVQNTLEDIARVHNGFIRGDKKPLGEILPQAMYVVAIYDKQGNLLYDARPETTINLGTLENVKAVREFEGHVFLPGGTGERSRKSFGSDMFGKTGTHNKNRHAQAVVSDGKHTIAVLLYNERTPPPTRSSRYRNMWSSDAMFIAANTLTTIDPINTTEKKQEYKEAVAWARTVARSYHVTTEQGPEGYFVNADNDGTAFYNLFTQIPEKYRTFTGLDFSGYPTAHNVVAKDERDYIRYQGDTTLVQCNYDTNTGSMTCYSPHIRRGKQTREILELTVPYADLVRAERLMNYAEKQSVSGAGNALGDVRSLMNRLDATFVPQRQYIHPKTKTPIILLRD